MLDGLPFFGFSRRRWIGGGLLGLFLFLLGLAISPELHRWVHHDANDRDHSCAVTLILTNGNAIADSSIHVAFQRVEVMEETAALPHRGVPCFLCTCVCEHAPPVFG